MTSRPPQSSAGPDIVQPPESPVDDLGDAVLLGLSRPIGWRQSPRLIRTFVTGTLTLGVYPILEWQPLFRQYAALEQQQLWHLSKWFYDHVSEPEGDRLLRAANSVQPSAHLRWLIYLCLAALAGVFCYAIAVTHRTEPLAALHVAYVFPRYLWASFGRSHAALYMAWNAILIAAYLAHGRQLSAYDRSIRRYIREVNEVLKIEGRPRLDDAKADPIAPTNWKVAGFIFLCTAAVWGWPMMLTGWRQASLIRRTSKSRRAGLALVLHRLMQASSPDAPIPLPIYLRRQCGNELCASPLAEGVAYCPRCGRRA